MPKIHDNRRLDQYRHIADPSDSFIAYETNGLESLDELKRRLGILISHHDIVFKGPSAIYLEDKWVEASFFPEWTGERKLVVVKGINCSEIASADARYKKGGRAERLRPGMAMLEIESISGIGPFKKHETLEYAIEMAKGE